MPASWAISRVVAACPFSRNTSRATRSTSSSEMVLGRPMRPSVPRIASVEKQGGRNERALSGIWKRKEGELKIEFPAKDSMRISPHGSDEVLVILCTCTLEKGEVKAKVSGFEGKEEAKEKVKGHLPVG